MRFQTQTQNQLQTQVKLSDLLPSDEKEPLLVVGGIGRASTSKDDNP